MAMTFDESELTPFGERDLETGEFPVLKVRVRPFQMVSKTDKQLHDVVVLSASCGADWWCDIQCMPDVLGPNWLMDMLRNLAIYRAMEIKRMRTRKEDR